MKKNHIIFLLAIIMLSWSACKKDELCDCFKSTGETVTESRTLTNFNKISLEDNINLHLIPDSVFGLTITAGKNLIPSITSDVTDSCLYLKNENICNWVRSYKRSTVDVYLKYKSLRNIIYNNGSGNITTNDTLRSSYFQLDDMDGSGTIQLIIDAGTSWFNLHTGPADLVVTGNSGVNYLYANGNGKADLLGLETGYTFMNNRSTNDCYVTAQKDMEVEIDYIGNVYYTGNPLKIVTNIKGTGKLIKL